MTNRRILSISVMKEMVDFLDLLHESGIISSKSEFIRSAITEKFSRDIEVIKMFVVKGIELPKTALKMSVYETIIEKNKKIDEQKEVMKKPPNNGLWETIETPPETRKYIEGLL